MTTPINNSNKPSSALPIPRTHTPSTSTTPSTTQSPSDQEHARGQYEIFSNPVVTQDTRKKMLTTMLFTLCEKGNEQLVMSVLKQGADVNARNENKQTPLHIASQLGHLKVVKVLVQNGANCAVLDTQDKSPLLLAIQAEHKDIVAYLLPITKLLLPITKQVGEQKKEVLPKTIPLQQDEPLVKAYQSLVMAVNSGTFKICIEKLKKDNLSHLLGLILLDSCHTNDLKLVERLITEGEVDVNSRSINNSTPLHLVCEMGHHDLFEFLLKHKNIDLNPKNDQGLYPIQLACVKGHVKIIEKLLKKGALLNNTTFNPLHHAIDNGKTNVVKCIILHLIEKGNDLNAPLKEGGPPLLHLACQHGKFEIISFLLQQREIDINAVHKGFYPIQVACLKGHTHIVKELLKKKANLNNDENTAIVNAIASGKLNTVECIIGHLIKNGTDINAPHKAIQDTPFHYICHLGNMEMAKLFLKYKEKYNLHNAKNSLGITPLHEACLQGHVEIVKLLLENKVETKTKAIHHFTVLHAAVYRNQTEVVKVLLDSKKFDFFETTEWGFNALDIAYENQNASMLQLFEKYGIHLITDGEFLIIQNDFIKFVNEPEMSLSEDSLSDDKIIITDPLPPSIEVKSPIVSTDSPSPVSIALPTASVTKKSKNLHKEKKPAQITSQKPAKTPQYVVEWHENFKWPKSLNSKLQGTVMQHLRLLKNWPNKTGLDLKKMAGADDVFRLRVGQHRVLFSVDKETQKIRIHSIGLRKNVYKNLNSNFIKK